jgi:hypothetical protein
VGGPSYALMSLRRRSSLIGRKQGVRYGSAGSMAAAVLRVVES